MPLSNTHDLPSAGLARQFAAMIYDSFLIAAVLFIAMGIAVAFNNSEAIEPTPAFFYSISIIYLFFFRYIRVLGKSNTVNKYFHLVNFQCCFSSSVPDVQNGFIGIHFHIVNALKCSYNLLPLQLS